MATRTISGQTNLGALIEYAKTLDAPNALAAYASIVPRVPRNALGALATQQQWALAGLHSIRANPVNAANFTADDIAASSAWLEQNGWVLPA